MDNYRTYPQSPVTSRNYSGVQHQQQQYNSDTRDTNSRYASSNSGGVNGSTTNGNESGNSSSNDFKDYFKTPKMKKEQSMFDSTVGGSVGALQQQQQQMYPMEKHKRPPTREESLQQEIETLKTLLKNQSQQTETTTLTISNNETTINTLRQQMKSLQDLKETLTKDNQEFKSLVITQDQYINNLKNELNNSLHTIDDLNKNIERKNKSIHNWELMNTRNNETINNFISRNKILEKDLQDVKTELELRPNTAIITQPSDFKSKMDQLSYSLVEADNKIQSLENENNKLKAIIGNSNNHNQSNRSMVDDSTYYISQNMSGMNINNNNSRQQQQQQQQQYTLLTKENIELKNQIKELTLKLKSFDSLNEAISRIQMEKEQLEQDVDALNNQLVEQDAKYMEFKNNIKSEQRNRPSVEDEFDESKKTVIDIIKELNVIRETLQRFEHQSSLNRSASTTALGSSMYNRSNNHFNYHDIQSNLNSIYNDIIYIKSFFVQT
ncbi:hypothetical protein PPL_02348 [Heterostelium album PN500]|uniref:Uncharacterized protein n=1 Tax=Heterostelium pallidum (strain ATCC 26659 / Pp 5 / PN500) TaxID=670386 RepID=D3B221_HETP5|nr:hypothetical protein PPL_02348 [Heterostelium album PN500]EFA85345.1 hypothetical protein PPL_02348 [Heterostelium album PN500]|eukprot:XP_020437454.1 hypothetical protein PPL_02348 [Heterostelium album PN500]